MQNQENKKSIQDKLSTIKYNCCEVSHLKVEQEKCLKCKNKPCMDICPAGVYSVDETSGKTKIEHENCLECGACKIVCPYGTIDWEYPPAGCGVVLKNN